MKTSEKPSVLPTTSRYGRIIKRLPWTELGVIAFFFILVVFLSWPLVLEFTSKVPAGPVEDRYQNLWNLWWFNRAVSNFQNPLVTNMLYYPYFNASVPLYLHSLQPFNCLVVWPLVALFNPTAGYNGMVIFSFVTSGFGAFLLGRHLTRNFWAGIIAGILFGFSSIHIDQVKTSITNIMSIQWLPYFALGLILWHETRQLKWAAMAGVFMAICIYTDYYNTIDLAFFAVFFYLVTSFPKNWLKQLPGLLVAAGVSAVLAAFMLIGAIQGITGNFYFAQYDNVRDIRASMALSSILLPNNTNSIYFWLAVIVIGLLVVYARDWRGRVFFWGSLMIFSYVFALGPDLQIVDQDPPATTGIPMPYAFFKLIPGVSIARAPMRINIVAQLCLALLVAFGFAWLVKVSSNLKFARNREKVVNGVLAAAIGIPYLLTVSAFPWPLVEVKPDSFVSYLPKTGNYYLLELPITRHYSFDHERMFNSTYHQRPVMGGYLSRPVVDPYRAPDSPFRYFTEQRYLSGGDPNKEIFAAENSFAVADNLLRLYNFNYVVVYKQDYRFERERQAVRNLLENRLGKNALVTENDNEILYRVPESLQQARAVPGITLDEDGWYGVEQNADGNYRWMKGNATIYVALSQSRQVKVSFSAQAFGGDRTIRVKSGDKLLYQGTVTPAPGRVEFTLDIPAGSTGISLESVTPASTAKAMGLGDDTRPLAFLIRNLEIS